MAFFVNHSFDHHFASLLDKLEKKYGTEMFELEGIDKKNLDIAKFTNKFLETQTTADISVDANANVDDTSILSWNYEFPKPLMKLNGLYFLWKDALKKHGIKRANKMIELEIAGGIRIHDLHGWMMPYSYSGSTKIDIKTNGIYSSNISLFELFHSYESEKIQLPDREVIDFSNKNIYVLDGNGKYTKIIQCLRHKRDTQMLKFTYIKNGNDQIQGNLYVTSNHPMIMADDTEKEAKLVKINDLLKGNFIDAYTEKRVIAIEECNEIKFDFVYDITTESNTFAIGLLTCHNCYATSLAPIVFDGMPWVKNIKVKPIKHFLTLINNSIKYIYSLSTQCVGAIAVPDLLVYAEYFIRKDYGENWYEKDDIVNLIKQLFQHWIYSVNDKARGNQSPFVNVSVFDKYWRQAMFGEHTNPDFSKCNLDNLKRVQRLFVDVLIEQQEDNPFTFPVMTACQLKDAETGEILDKDWLDWIGEISVKNKLMNFYTSETCDSLSSCCRLRNNIQNINNTKQEYTNSFGVGGLNIGSHRVVCINLPQIAYIAKYSDKNDMQAFYNILESRIKVAQDILDIHRELLMRLIDNGNLPMYTHHCMDLSKQYSTLGFIGLYECLEILGLNMVNEDGIAEGKKIIGLFNKLNADRTAKDGRIRNVEQIPGESAAVTFCLKDKLQFANTNDYDLYANQYIPLIKEALMTDRIRLQGEFDSSVSGGSILHIDIDQALTKEQIIDIIQLCAKNNVIYFALDDCLAQCTSCGKVHVGKFEKSPCHAAPMNYFMRVVGFRTPVKAWNKTRRTKDFPRRYLYSDTP